MKSKILLITILLVCLSSVNANAEEKIRIYKDSKDETQSIAWWKDLASCAGTYGAILTTLTESNATSKQYLDNVGNLAAWSITRYKLDTNKSDEEAENAILEYSDAATDDYLFEIDGFSSETEVKQFQDFQASVCQNIINEYKIKFPNDLK